MAQHNADRLADWNDQAGSARSPHQARLAEACQAPSWPSIQPGIEHFAPSRHRSGEKPHKRTQPSLHQSEPAELFRACA